MTKTAVDDNNCWSSSSSSSSCAVRALAEYKLTRNFCQIKSHFKNVHLYDWSCTTCVPLWIDKIADYYMSFYIQIKGNQSFSEPHGLIFCSVGRNLVLAAAACEAQLEMRGQIASLWKGPALNSLGNGLKQLGNLIRTSGLLTCLAGKYNLPTVAAIKTANCVLHTTAVDLSL